MNYENKSFYYGEIHFNQAMNVFFKSSLNWHSFILLSNFSCHIATLISVIKIKRGTSDLLIKDELCLAEDKSFLVSLS